MVERVAKIIEDATRAVLRNPLLLGSLMIVMVALKVRFGANSETED